MCCCMGHWLEACIGPQYWLFQPSYPSLKEQLGMLSLVTSGLENEARLDVYKGLSYCLYLMLISHF